MERCATFATSKAGESPGGLTNTNLFTMKNFLLFLITFLPMFLKAQTEGKIIYTESVKFEMEIPDSEDEEIKKLMAQMPKEQTFPKMLLFIEAEWLYADVPGSEDEGTVELSHESEGMDFQMKIERPVDIKYGNLDEDLFLNQREFFGRKFLITDKLEKQAWKMTGEQRKIGEYVCQKATAEIDSQQVVAWFTPQILVSAGPDGYGGLPGLILELEIDNGKRHVIATRIELKPLEEGTFERPDKGKKVSREEFKQIETEKRKEMNEQNGGPGVRIMIRN